MYIDCSQDEPEAPAAGDDYHDYDGSDGPYQRYADVDDYCFWEYDCAPAQTCASIQNFQGVLHNTHCVEMADCGGYKYFEDYDSLCHVVCTEAAFKLVASITAALVAFTFM